MYLHKEEYVQTLKDIASEADKLSKEYCNVDSEEKAIQLSNKLCEFIGTAMAQAGDMIQEIREANQGYISRSRPWLANNTILQTHTNVEVLEGEVIDDTEYAEKLEFNPAPDILNSDGLIDLNKVMTKLDAMGIKRE